MGQGVGAFVCASDVLRPKPLISGSGQEHSHRSGEAVALIAGFGAAAEKKLINTNDYKALRDAFESGLKQLDSEVHIHGRTLTGLTIQAFLRFQALAKRRKLHLILQVLPCLQGRHVLPARPAKAMF